MDYISKYNLFKLLDTLKEDYKIFVPVKKGSQLFYKKFENHTDDIVIGEIRPFEPLKVFFTQAREVVAEGFSDDVPGAEKKPFAIIGVKACDLKGFKVLDHVFKDKDCPDPFYINNRKRNLIIASDCTCAINTCFCLALGIKPHPQADFDLNLSKARDGFVVEAGSQKGEEIIKRNSALFEKASKGAISDKDELRAKVIKEVEKSIKESEVPRQDQYKGIVEKGYKSDIWADEANQCVECGACNAVCPTCHCFLLYDQKDEQKMERLRIWDSCMIKDFAKVAGGHNPRPQLWMRLRNRFEKKFDFFPKVADVYACTGCGRCISACPAKIDIRKVLKSLVKNG